MSDEINYKNNPLNGVGLKTLVTELVEHYGFDILFAYLNINCFKTNPSIPSSIKFLKKTDWAREKVEAFYLYEYKSLPHAPSSQRDISPRDRIIPDDQTPGEPAKLTLEEADQRREERERKAAEWERKSGRNRGGNSSGGRGTGIAAGKRRSSDQPERTARKTARPTTGGQVDPWARAKQKS